MAILLLSNDVRETLVITAVVTRIIVMSWWEAELESESFILFPELGIDFDQACSLFPSAVASNAGAPPILQKLVFSAGEELAHVLEVTHPHAVDVDGEQTESEQACITIS